MENQATTRSPTDFLSTVLGQTVKVKLNSGIDYRGTLACLDGYMNIALENTEEYVDGRLKNKYGDTFIRGNNVLIKDPHNETFSFKYLKFIEDPLVCM